MIHYSNSAMEDLQTIRTQDGQEVMLMLFEWCERLDEAATRIMAERLRESDPIFRLRVEDFHITFQLRESAGDHSVCIVRVRKRNRSY